MIEKEIKTVFETVVQKQLSLSQLLTHTGHRANCTHGFVGARPGHLQGRWGQLAMIYDIDTSQATCPGGGGLLDSHKTNATSFSN